MRVMDARKMVFERDVYATLGFPRLSSVVIDTSQFVHFSPFRISRGVSCRLLYRINRESRDR
jgi:hypothetical protein